MSTDYVFDGEREEPYVETSPTRPLGVYGASKLAGEVGLMELGSAAVVLRTSWVFSARPSFLSNMLKLAAEREALSVVHDQVSCPTFARDLAGGIAFIAHAVRADPHRALMERRGIYHLAGAGVASRWDLVSEAVARTKQPLRVKTVTPVAADAFPARAVRPAYSALECGLAADVWGLRLPEWRDAIRRMLD
jgi:dTDP-4-dehydrorhamnose reductase